MKIIIPALSLTLLLAATGCVIAPAPGYYAGPPAYYAAPYPVAPAYYGGYYYGHRGYYR